MYCASLVLGAFLLIAYAIFRYEEDGELPPPWIMDDLGDEWD